jgi:lactoylglutathione lyase
LTVTRLRLSSANRGGQQVALAKDGSALQLANEHLDVALFTNNEDAMLAFWQQQVGVPLVELLKPGGGMRQHRHDLNGSTLKLNAVRDPLPTVPLTGFRELLIARPGLTAPRTLTDPDGNVVTLVPPGSDGVTTIGLRLAVTDEAKFHDFYRDVLELEPVGDRAYRFGSAVFLFAADPSATRVGEARGNPGFRSVTAQVADAQAAHTRALSRGAEEGRAPVTMAPRAIVSFIRDPDGNWIEFTQRLDL